MSKKSTGSKASRESNWENCSMRGERERELEEALFMDVISGKASISGEQARVRN